MRNSTTRALLRTATAVAVICTAAVMFLPAMAAEFSTAPRLVPAACNATIAFDCPESAISLFHTR
jgi:hypothetical protein